MVTVALIGADGAGKTTVARRIANASDAPGIKYLYMGTNPEASNVALPTTRLVHWLRRGRGTAQEMGGPPDPTRRSPRPRSTWKRALRFLKTAPGLVNRISEECYRQLVAWYLQRRGFVVLFDRHFFPDYYAHDVGSADIPLDRRLHGWFLSRLYPRPDLIVLLDAPSEVLFARKGEGTVELLERRRLEYFTLRDQVEHFFVIDADRPIEDVAEDVVERIRDVSAAARGTSS